MKKILLIVPFLVLGCATRPVKLLPAPEKARLQGLANFAESELTESEKIVVNYRQAMLLEGQGNKEKACSLFSTLSKIDEFPLKSTAIFHKLINCELADREIKKIWDKFDPPKYLKEQYLKKSLTISREKNWSKEEASFLFQLVDYTKLQSEKITFLKNAIDLFNKNSDEKSIKMCKDKLKTISPKFETEISTSNILAIAKDFEDDRQFSRSRELLEQIIKNEKEEYNIDLQIKALNNYRTSFKVERKLKEFLNQTEAMVQFLKTRHENFPGDQKIAEALVDSQLALARATWTEHMSEDAQKILFDIKKNKFGNNNQMANCYWLLGSIELENKNNQSALSYFKKAGTFSISDNSLKENVYWSVVWNHYILKKFKDVDQLVTNYIKNSSNQNFIDKLQFWKAQSLLKMHKLSEANSIFESLLNSDQFSYYGILSGMYLKSTFISLKAPEINTNSSQDLELNWLLATEEKVFAQKRLKEINPKFKTYAQKETAFPLYIESGWFQGAAAQLYNFPAKKRSRLTEKYISGIFPIPFLDQIESASLKFHIPSELILAITRQESNFEPSEKSWAHAYGLMQMIPEKAKELSLKYQIPYRDYNDLFSPEINIQMGAALLSELTQNSNGQFAQTVAGYNANPGVFKVWKSERYNGNYIEFIEMIPYEETRNYIKLVFRNFITYRRILHPESFIIDPDFFEKPFN